MRLGARVQTPCPLVADNVSADVPQIQRLSPHPFPEMPSLPRQQNGTQGLWGGTKRDDDPQIPFVMRWQTFRRGNPGCWVPTTWREHCHLL